MQHWSARGLFDRRATLWGSWAVSGPELRFWFAGDTGYCPVFPVQVLNRKNMHYLVWKFISYPVSLAGLYIPQP